MFCLSRSIIRTKSSSSDSGVRSGRDEKSATGVASTSGCSAGVFASGSAASTGGSTGGSGFKKGLFGGALYTFGGFVFLTGAVCTAAGDGGLAGFELAATAGSAAVLMLADDTDVDCVGALVGLGWGICLLAGTAGTLVCAVASTVTGGVTVAGVFICADITVFAVTC